MAIQDRNLSVGTKLHASYKGQTYRAEVVLNPNATGDRPIAYKVEGNDELFKSPSAAGTAITEKACNGWAFWSVGDGSESTGPVTSTKTRPAAEITPAPKPEGKPRGRKTQAKEPPATEPEASNEARDDAPTAAADDGQPVRRRMRGDVPWHEGCHRALLHDARQGGRRARMTIMLEISVERTAGKFASKDDVANELIGLVDGHTLYVEESEYEVTNVSVYELPRPVKPARR